MGRFLKQKANLPQPLGLLLNQMQWVPDACLKVYEGDGFMAHRILRWKIGITYAFYVLAIDGECWTTANSRQWNVF